MAQVLVIEDEDNIATALEFLLLREGYGHARLASGGHALDTIRTTMPDLVLLDVMLPELSGYEILQKMRSDPAFGAVRVILMTARGSAVEQRNGMALGADGFVAKPFELVELRAEIARVLS